jgi:hypothetical protein
MDLQPVARVGGDEGAAAGVLLHTQTPPRGALQHLVELVVVERDPDVVDARQRPLPRLDDHVHRTPLELAQPVAEPLLLQLVPRDSGLEMDLILADTTVARDQPEAELAQVTRLDLPNVARDQVVVEKLQARASWQEVLV